MAHATEGPLGPQKQHGPHASNMQAGHEDNQRRGTSSPQNTSSDSLVNSDSTLIPDRGEAERFLNALEPRGKFTFQTFDDSPERKPNLGRKLHGRLEKHWKTLCALNAKGAGIFVTVNETDLRGRRAENVVRVRSVFADLDGSPLEPVESGPLAPHLTIETSPGRFHAYWWVDDLPRAEFRGVQQALIARFNGDPIIHDLPRVMRIPGFYHLKAAPFQTKILTLENMPRYAADQIRKAFPAIRTTAATRHVTTTKAIRGGPIPEHERNATLTSEAGRLRRLGHDQGEIEAALLQENQERCVPPLQETEVRGVATSVSRYPPGQPMSLNTAHNRISEVRQLITEQPALLVDPDTLTALSILKSEDSTTYAEFMTKGPGKGQKKDLERRMTKNNLRVVRETNQERSVGDILRDLELTVPDGADDLVMPDLYVLDSHGVGVQVVTEAGKERNEVAARVVLVTKRVCDVETGDVLLQLHFQSPSGWKSISPPRGDVLDARKVTALANQDLPVSSGSASALSRYFDKFEAENLGILPEEKVVGALGWVAGPEPAFLLGSEIIAGPSAPSIKFNPQDVGDAQVAAAFATEGTWEGWIAAVTPVAGYPRPMMALYAALSAPFLKIFGANNFGVDFSGKTSTGKTTCLRLAASACGIPDERDDDQSVLHGWDTTKNAIERTCGIGRDLPTILDDSKRANTRHVGAILYQIANGTGRQRASLKGLRATRNCRTVLLSSGEAALITYTQEAGIRARLLTIHGKPFGRDDAATRRLVDSLNRGVLENYGHALPKLLRFLVDHVSDWPEFRKRYRDRAREISEGASGIEARLADHAAVISTAGEIAHTALGFPWPWEDPVDRLWPVIVAQVADADIDIRALRDVMTWAVANRHRFYDPSAENHEVHPLGWLGSWNTATTWEFAGISSPELKKWLAGNGYDHGAVIAGWHERGWLRHRKDRSDWSAKTPNGSMAVFAILREAIEALDDDPVVSEPPVGPVEPDVVLKEPEPRVELVSCFACDHSPDNARCGVRREFSVSDHECDQFQQAETFDQVEQI